jgi:hypothetical protein
MVIKENVLTHPNHCDRSLDTVDGEECWAARWSNCSKTQRMEWEHSFAEDDAAGVGEVAGEEALEQTEFLKEMSLNWNPQASCQVKVRWEACRDSALAATWSTWVAVFA